MPSHTHEFLALLRDTRQYLTKHTEPILATAADCAYFRKRYSVRKEAPRAEPIVRPAPKLAAPAPTPIPVPMPLPLPLPAPTQNAPPTEFPLWKRILTTLAPQLRITAEIPGDAEAKKIASQWKTKNQTAPITVLFYQEPPEQKQLLEQITSALNVHFGPATLISADTIEKENQWKTLVSAPLVKLIVCCDSALWGLQGLSALYKEKERQIGDKPLFLIPDLSLYLKDPTLKRSLWNALCQISRVSLSTEN